jgi:hypothetical protein
MEVQIGSQFPLPPTLYNFRPALGVLIIIVINFNKI